MATPSSRPTAAQTASRSLSCGANRKDGPRSGCGRAIATTRSGSEDDWRSVFLGLAFGAGGELYASEGNSGRVRVSTPSREADRAPLNSIPADTGTAIRETWHSTARAACCGSSTRGISGWPPSMCGHGGRSLPFARAACRLPRLFRPTGCGCTSRTQACSSTRRCRRRSEAAARDRAAISGVRISIGRGGGGAIRETASGP